MLNINAAINLKVAADNQLMDNHLSVHHSDVFIAIISVFVTESRGHAPIRNCIFMDTTLWVLNARNFSGIINVMCIGTLLERYIFANFMIQLDLICNVLSSVPFCPCYFARLLSR